MSFEVGRARLVDAPAILALHRQVLAEGEYFITEVDEYVLSLAEQEQIIRSIRASDNSHMWVARDGTRVAGFLALTGGVLRRLRHTVKLEIMLAPAYRGQGVGRLLLETGLRWAEEHPEIEKVGLSVFDTNSRAIALYASMGFVEEGRRAREYKLPDGRYRGDVLMYRWVGPVTG